MTQFPFSLHDAEIRSLECDRFKKTASGIFQLPDSSYIQIDFKGVEYYRATDFIMQNVVARHIIFDEQNGGYEDIFDKLEWLTSLEGCQSFLNDESKEKFFTAIQRGQYKLSYFEPSWGCELAVLYEKLSYKTF